MPVRNRFPIALAIALAGAALAPAAQAASVTKTLTDVVYYAEPGEDNDLTITDPGGTIVFEEDSIAVSTSPPCLVATGTRVTCSGFDVERIIVDAGDGTNRVVASAPYELRIDGADGTSNAFTGGPIQNLLIGGNGHDVLVGGAGKDEIQGGDGSDDITGMSGADELLGGVGDDRFFSATLDGADQIDGGGDSDTVDYGGRATPVTVTLDNSSNDGGFTMSPFPLAEGDNVRSSVEIVRGGSGDDTLTGSPAGNRLYGGGGSDLLAGGLGADRLEGGAGTDAVSYAGYGAPVAVDLDGEQADDGAAGEHDTIATDIEGIAGGSGFDELTGNASANVIRGGPGDDLIDGLGGPDELFGEAGDDTLASLDGGPDSDDCGDGTDTTVADPLDARTACELPAPPPPPDAGSTGGATGTTGTTGTTGGTTEGMPEAPAEGTATAATGSPVRIGPSRLRLGRRGAVRPRVGCPETAAQSCTGTLKLRGKGRRYGRTSFSIAAGRTAVVPIRIARSLRRAHRTLRLRLIASVRDYASAPRESRRTVTVIPFARKT